VNHEVRIQTPNPQMLFIFQRTKLSLRFALAGRKRPGLAEIVGSILSIALTILAGVAVFGYVRTEAGVSEGQYGQSVGQTVNHLAESFGVVQANFNYPGSANFPPGCSTSCRFASTSVTLYFYNSGTVQNQFQQVEIYNASRSVTDLTFTGSYVTDLNNAGSCKVAATTSLESPLLGTATGSLAVGVGTIVSVTLSLPTCYTTKGAGYQFVQGDTYIMKVLGVYGNTVSYYQVM